MDRREMMQSGLALTLAAASVSAMAQAGKADAGHDHHHHDHGSSGKYGDLVHAAAECGHIGQVCVAHCLVLLGQGDTAMAACAISVSQMLAACDALQKLSTQNSKYVPKMAALALAVCEDCEKECRKHESKHKECKDCADACVACARECRKVAA